MNKNNKPKISTPIPTSTNLKSLKTNSNKKKGFPTSKIHVYTRIRPILNENESKDDIKELLKVTVKRQVACRKVFNIEENNKNVFESLNNDSRIIENVCKGGNSVVFAFGHTGAGKSHTMIGYDEVGVIQRSITELLCSLTGVEQRLRIQLVEIENEKLYDLMKRLESKSSKSKDEKSCECTIRANEAGVSVIRGETIVAEDGLVIVSPLSSIVGRTADELMSQLRDCLACRTTGSSNVHNQSSRSHLIVVVDVTRADLQEIRAKLLEAEAKLVQKGKIRDDLRAAIQAGRFRLLPGLNKYEANPDWKLDPVLDAKEKEATKIVDEVQSVVNDLLEKEKAIMKELGFGSLSFVDLAGAEYAGDVSKISQSKEEKRQSAYINKSLLSLKEAIRNINCKISTIKPNFRTSMLTRFLEPYINPKARRLGSDIDSSFLCVMLANISIAKEDRLKSKSTLKYADLLGKINEQPSKS